MSEYQASDFENAIPSRSSFTPSDHQKAYTSGQTIRFFIEPFNSFVDPRQSTLNFKVQVKDASALCTFSKKCGVHSLISQLRIYDMESGTQLENIQSYAELADKLHFYSENDSIRNKRRLTELLEYTSRDFDGIEYDDKPARNADQSQLFTHQYKTGSLTYEVLAQTTADPNICEVAVRLYSGVLGAPSDKMFPVMLTGGLRVEIDLNSADKALQLWTAEGICNDDGTIATDLSPNDSCRFGIASATPATANPVTEITLYCEKNPGYEQVLPTDAPSAESFTAGMQLVKNQLVGCVNLAIGKTLSGFDKTGTLVDIGVIQSLECNANEDSGGVVEVLVRLAGLVNGDTLVGGSGVGGVPNANSCFIKKSNMFNTVPSVEVSDVRLILKTAQPPQSYIDKLIKQTQTEEGATMDYITWDVYRNNVQGSENQIQLNMPTINKRALSVLTLPVVNSSTVGIGYDNLATIVDDADNYNYLVDNKLQPTRKVDLKPISQAPSRIAQVASYEWEKALGSSKIHVKNLDYQESDFGIGRSLARFGGVYNLAEDGNLSLRIEYGQPTKNKLFINYIAGLRRLVVNRDGRHVEV